MLLVQLLYYVNASLNINSKVDKKVTRSFRLFIPVYFNRKTLEQIFYHVNTTHCLGNNF